MKQLSRHKKSEILRKNLGFLFLIILVLFPWFGCQLFSDRTSGSDQPVARVNNKYLYYKDLKGLVADGVSAADSSKLIDYHIESWIRQNLLLKTADQMLPKNKIDLEKQIENYRESLIIFLLEQELLEQNLDTIINPQEIKAYYLENEQSFELKDPVLKASFVILKNEAPQQDSVKYWLQNPVEINRTKLQEYCFQYSLNFSINPEWYQFASFTDEIPISEEELEILTENKTFYETSDAIQTYLVNIKEYGLKGETAPLDYKKQDIAKVIVNKRRHKYLKKIKEEIYRQALNNNEFEVY